MGGAARVAIAVSVLLSGCDLPVARIAAGPRASAQVPSEGATDVDRTAAMRVGLERRIAPSSLAPDAVRIVSGARAFPLAIEIDVMEPGLVLTPRGRLDPEIDYVLQIDPLRDLDGRVGDPLEVSFRTGWESTAPVARPVATFDEVAPIFTARCATPGCHAATRPTLGLDLSSAEGIRRTAIGVPAAELRGPVEGSSTAGAGGLLGLPVLTEGSPARSYLVYKLLGDEHAPGSPMPPPSGEGGEGALSRAEVATIVAWIRAGAPLSETGGP